MQVTSASPLPRVEMVAVNGLNSQRARPQRCNASEARRRRSSTANSLQVQCGEWHSFDVHTRVETAGWQQLSAAGTRVLPAAAAAAPHQAASRSAPQKSSLPQALCTVTLGSRAAASSGV